MSLLKNKEFRRISFNLFIYGSGIWWCYSIPRIIHNSFEYMDLLVIFPIVLNVFFISWLHKHISKAIELDNDGKEDSLEPLEVKMKCKKRINSKSIKYGRKIIPRKNKLAKLTIEDFVPVIKEMSINEFNKWSLILFEDCYTMMKFHYRRKPIRWFFAKDCITVFQMLLSSLAGENQLNDYSSVDEKLDVLLEHFVLRNSPRKHSTSICYYLIGFEFVAHSLDDFDQPLKILETKAGTDVFDDIAHLPFFIIEDGLTKMSNDAFLKKAYEAAVKQK